MITSKELATLAGVSQSTVSRCLNGSPLVSEQTRARVQTLAAQYHFAFNHAAQGLRTNRSGSVGFVFSENFRSFVCNVAQSEIYYGVRQKLSEHRIDCIPIFDQTTFVEGREQSNIEQYIRNRKVDGLIFNRSKISAELLEQCQLPYILIYDPDEDAPYPYVIANNHEKAGRLVGEAFAEKGYRRMAEIAGSAERPDSVRKHTGFCAALEKHGISFDEANLFYGDYGFESGYRIGMEHAAAFRRSEACFVHNDTMALGLLKAMREQDIRVPEDLAVIGHDNIEMASWFYPGLSTVSINFERIAEISAGWMMELLADESLRGERRRATVDCRLVLRDTFV